MPAANLNPHDASPPARVDLDDDLDSAVVENDPKAAPPDNTYLRGDSYNNALRAVADHERVVPFLLATIDGASAAIVSLTSLRKAYTAIAHPYTLIRYPAGDAAGDFKLTWSASAIPPAIADAEAAITDGTDCTITTQLVSAGVLRIRTRARGTGTGTNCRFQLRHY